MKQKISVIDTYYNIRLVDWGESYLSGVYRHKLKFIVREKSWIGNYFELFICPYKEATLDIEFFFRLLQLEVRIPISSIF